MRAWLIAPGAAAIIHASVAAQAGTPAGRVTGRVIDRDQGTPVAMALVRITASDTQAPLVDTTDAEGRYSVALPRGAGPFTLRAERIGYRPLTITVTPEEVAGGVHWRDLRLSAEAVRLAGLTARPNRPERQQAPRRAPGGNDQTTLSWFGGTVPVEPGDLAGLAALQGGVQEAGGGVSFFAQDPSQNRTTLDGARFGATTLPQEALASVSVVASTYDVSRGEFSGGLIAATTLGGTNRFGGALRSRFSTPWLQWRARPDARWPESSFASAQGGTGGALVPNRLFWYAAFSAARRSVPPVSLESAAPAVLQGLGVHPDSVARLAVLLRSSGAGPAAGLLPGDVRTDALSGLLRLDYDFAAAHSLMLRLDARRLEIGGLGVDPLATLESGGTGRDGGRGGLAQLTSRLGRVENELRVYGSEETRRTVPRRRGPAGTVRVASLLDGDQEGSVVLRFGASQTESESRDALFELSDQATATLGAAHRLTLGGVLTAEGATVSAAGNRFGTFAFNSLDDLRAGRPALFTRTLGRSAGTARARYGAFFLGDTWQRGRVQVTFGGRLEGRWYPSGDEAAEVLVSPFGVQPGRVPGEWGLSPRLGWSYDGAGWYLIGGVGEFRGSVPLPALAAALGEDGSAGAVSLACVGAAAPAPAWDRYALDPGAAPEACAQGAPLFAGRTAPLTLFAPDFAAPRVWRASVGGHVPLPGRFRLNFDASFTRGVSQPAALDRNLGAAAEFELPAEEGRPVYAPATAIDPATGGVAPGTPRPFPAWEAVREIGARGRSSVAQATVDLGYPFPSVGRLSLSGSYTFTRAWDEVGGLPALEGSAPFAVDPARLSRGASDLERRHDLRLTLGLRPWPWVRLGVLGRLTSGAPFTPRVDGDVNGDGARNDPAFVFDPATASDTAVAAGMARLLAGAPGRIRECLARQAGRVARRNSCRTAWTAGLDLRTDFQLGRGDLERRLRISVTTSNALGLVDRLVNGRDGLRGWGGPALPDPTLLRVSGFDPVGRAFRYEVNPGFGTRNSVLGGVQRPFALTIEGRVTIGADPAYQPLERLIKQSAGPGRSAEEVRQELSQRIPNLPAQVAALDSALRLGLTAQQRVRLQDDAEALGARLSPLADSIAATLSDVENGRRKNSRAAWGQINAFERQVLAVLDEELRTLRATLSVQQWEKLPEAIRVPARQLIPPRRPAAQTSGP